MKLELSDPESYFAFFYILAFAVSFVLIIIFSNRLKIPLRSVLLMLTTVSLCTIVGSRLSAIPLSGWGQIIHTGRIEGYEGRFAVGGLLFGLTGLVFSQKILRIREPIYELYSWIAPLGLGIQKLGCLFNGCCYGKPATILGGIKYPAGTSAHYHQIAGGLIHENDAFTIGVIPVQFIEAMCLIGISYLVWRSRKFWNKPGSSLIFSLILFSIVRFTSEFLRDPVSSGLNRAIISGLNILQWIVLAACIVFVILLVVNERRRSSRKDIPEPDQTLYNSIVYIMVLSAGIYLFRELTTPFEKISINIKFIPAVLLVAFNAVKTLKKVRFQLATTSLFALPLFLAIQTLLPDSSKIAYIKDFYQNKVKSYKRIDVGASPGKYFGTVRYNPQEGECGTTYTSEDYKYLYTLAGAGYSSVKKSGKAITTTGINLYGGSSKEIHLIKNTENSNFLFGVNPYVKYDLNWIGMGIGAHVGNIRWVPINPIDQIKFDAGTRFSPIMPEVYFRVGRRDILDLRYTYGSGFPSPLPVMLHEFSLGSGFSFKTDFSFRFGGAVSNNDSFTFISAEGLLSKKFGLTFKYNFGGEDLYHYSTDYSEVIDRKGRILFGLNYRFGFQK